MTVPRVLSALERLRPTGPRENVRASRVGPPTVDELQDLADFSAPAPLAVRVARRTAVGVGAGVLLSGTVLLTGAEAQAPEAPPRLPPVPASQLPAPAGGPALAPVLAPDQP